MLDRFEEQPRQGVAGLNLGFEREGDDVKRLRRWTFLRDSPLTHWLPAADRRDAIGGSRAESGFLRERSRGYANPPGCRHRWQCPGGGGRRRASRWLWPPRNAA